MGSVAVRSLLLAKSSDYFLLKPQHPGTNSPYSSPHISLMNKLREFIKGAASIIILLIPLRTFTARGKLMLVRGGGGGGGGGRELLGILGGGVPPGSLNTDSISDQKMSFSYTRF